MNWRKIAMWSIGGFLFLCVACGVLGTLVPDVEEDGTVVEAETTVTSEPESTEEPTNTPTEDPTEVTITTSIPSTPTVISTPTIRPTPLPTSPPPTPIPASLPSDCDSSYPTVCIPPSPPDLDCGEIVYNNFTVLQPDPHRFDRDNDGIGCEQ